MFDEAAEPKRSGHVPLIIVATVLGLLGVGFACLFLGGWSPAGTFQGASALITKTFHDVLGGGSRSHLAAEIDISGKNEASLAPQSAMTSSDAIYAASSSTSEAATPADYRQKKIAVSLPRVIKKKGASPPPAPSGASIEIDPPPAAAPISSVMPLPHNTAIAASAPSCDFAAKNEPTHQVLFNEIAWMGSRERSGETATQASNNEWMELRNNAGTSVDLSSWQIMNQSGKLAIAFDNRERIGFGEFFLLERGGKDAIPGIAADKTYSGALSNAGEWLRMFDRNCRLIDEVNASGSWPGGDNATKKTLERNNTDLDWHTSGYAGGTPKAVNSVVLAPATISTPQGPTGSPVADAVNPPAPEAAIIASEPTVSSSEIEMLPPEPPAFPQNAPAHLMIAAVQIAGAASTNDFIKLYNPTGAAIDISGWRLRKRASTGTEYSIRVLLTGSVVQPQGYFVWANSANGFALSLGANTSSTETLSADNSAALEDASGAVIDAVAWGTGANPFVEGAAYPTNPMANQVLSRKFASTIIQDTNNNAQDFEIR